MVTDAVIVISTVIVTVMVTAAVIVISTVIGTVMVTAAVTVIGRSELNLFWKCLLH